MKYILKDPLLVLSFLIVIILGCFIGNDISNDFVVLYVSKLTQIPARYLLIVVILFSNLLVFKHQNCMAISLRKKNFFSAMLSINKYEISVTLLLCAFLNFPIMAQNFNLFFENISIIIKLYINYVIVSLLILSIVKFIDIKINNRSISCAIFLIILAIIDVLLEHSNYFIFDNIYFDMSYIFNLPYLYSHYYIIAVILIFIIILFNLLSTFLRIKQDFMLECINEEN